MRCNILLALLVGLVCLSGCRYHEKEPDAEENTNTEANGNEKETPPSNEVDEPEPEPGEEEVCLLPPEAQDSDLAGKIEVGQEAPDFVIGKDANGNDLKLSDHRGKTVVVFFWATWCPYCKISLRQRGSMNALGVDIQDADDSQLVVVGVGTGIDDTADSQDAFMKTNEVPWNTIHDNGSKIEGLYGVLGMPTAVVIGRDGKIQTYGFYRKDSYQKPLLEYLHQECINKKPEGS